MLGTVQDRRKSVSAMLRLMRPKQWLKNIFVLAPLIFSGLFTQFNAMIHAVSAFMCFCIASSAVYVLNDLLDVEQDKRHPQKALSRPLAAGETTLRQAVYLLLTLYCLLWASLCFFEPSLKLILWGYIVLNLAYSLYLKHMPVIDIFTIAVGFVLRVFAGAVVLVVPVSSWMFVTTLCVALYLAAIKRRQELLHLQDLDLPQSRNVLSFYSLSLLNRYAEFAAFGALMFYSLFVVTSKPNMVISIPVVMFGLYRYWYVVESYGLGESPTDVFYADLQLILAGVLWVGISMFCLM